MQKVSYVECYNEMPLRFKLAFQKQKWKLKQ